MMPSRSRPYSFHKPLSLFALAAFMVFVVAIRVTAQNNSPGTGSSQQGGSGNGGQSGSGNQSGGGSGNSGNNIAPLGTMANPIYGIHDPAGLAQNPPDANVPCIVPQKWLGDVQWNRDVAPHNKIDDYIDNDTSGAAQFDIVVNFNIPIADGNRVPLQAISNVLNSMGTVQFVGTVIPTVCLSNVSRANIDLLAARTDVAFIEKQFSKQPTLDKACQATRVRGPLYSPNTVNDDFPTIFGDGVNIAIVDTGVDDPGGPGTTNQDLPMAVHTYKGSTGQFTNPDDKFGHGTHVAGIALGRGTTGGNPSVPRGVAAGPTPPEGSSHGAGLIDASPVDDNAGDFPPATLLATLQVLIDRKVVWNVGVINMSLGGGPSDDGTAVDAQLVDRATAAGIVVVISAGNSGPLNDGLTAPGTANTAITVASLDDNDTATRMDDVISDFSSRGPRADNHDGICLNELKPEVTAPGAVGGAGPNAEGILSAKLDTQKDGQRLQGTSMAAPHVAGICALMLQANPSLTPAQVKAALIATCERKGTPSAPGCSPDWNRDFGWGMVDAHAAVATVIAITNPLQPHTCVTSLNLQAPVGNEVWVKNTLVSINWNFTGNTSDSVDVLLMSGSTYVGAIAKQVAVSDLGTNWIVGSALDNNAPIPAGNQYGVLIRPSFDCGSNGAPTSQTGAFLSIIDSAIAHAAPPEATIPSGQTTPVVEIAPGGSIKLGNADTNGIVTTATKGMPPYTYSWLPSNFLDDPSSPRPVASPPMNITYTLTVRDSTGFTATDAVKVVVGNPLQVDAGPNKTFRLGGTVVLEGSAVGGTPPYTYEWSPIPDPTQPPGLNGVNIAQPTARPGQPTVYTLRVTDSTGTIKTDTVAIVPGLALTVIDNPGNAGIVNRDIAKDIYTPGDQIKLEAVPNAGWLFDHWDNPSSEFINRPSDPARTFNENPTPLTFRNADVKVTAIFKQIQPSTPPAGDTTTSGTSLLGGSCGAFAPSTMVGMLLGFGLMRRRMRRG